MGRSRCRRNSRFDYCNPIYQYPASLRFLLDMPHRIIYIRSRQQTRQPWVESSSRRHGVPGPCYENLVIGTEVQKGKGFMVGSAGKDEPVDQRCSDAPRKEQGEQELSLARNKDEVGTCIKEPLIMAVINNKRGQADC